MIRRLSSLVRVGVALGLLAALWVGTVTGVDRAARRADDRRIEDRALAVKGFARPVHDWLSAGLAEATALAESAGSAPARAVGEYLARPRAFGRDVLVVDRRMVVRAASPERLAFVDRVPSPCEREGEVDTTLHDAVAAVPSGTAVLTPIFDMPGTCELRTAAVAGTPASVVVVLADLGDLDARLSQWGDLGEGRSLMAVGPSGRVKERGADPRTASPALTGFLREAREHSARTGAALARRYGNGDDERVGAYEALPGGWGVVLQEDAVAFDPDPRSNPALPVAGILTAVFAAVLGLVAFFDVRRRRAMRRAEEDRNAFLSIVGHELRTPLTVLKGYTDTLASRWDSLDDRSRQMLVEQMAPQAQRQARTIEHLLTAAGLQAGTHPAATLAAVTLAPVVERVVAEFAPLAPLHRFDVDVDPDLRPVQADERALNQVLGELVDNALKYSPSGGAVRISARRAGRNVELAVQDEGVGLPSDHRRLFEPMVQGEDVDRRVHAEGGIGVGLFIVRSLLARMGGSVRTERVPNGARFVVSLRRAPARSHASVPEASSAT